LAEDTAGSDLATDLGQLSESATFIPSPAVPIANKKVSAPRSKLLRKLLRRAQHQNTGAMHSMSIECAAIRLHGHSLLALGRDRGVYRRVLGGAMKRSFPEPKNATIPPSTSMAGTQF